MRWPVETPSRRQRSRPALTRSAEDADAFAEFYAAYLDRVLVYFTRRTYDAEVAGDLAAETFAVALERRRQFRGRTVEEEQGWLFAIARSQLSHFWRRGEVERSAIARLGLEPPDLPSSEIAEIERMAGVAELRGRLTEALQQLNEDQAYSIRERILGGRSYGELAAELGVTEQVVRARVSRGLRAMADMLGDEILEAVA
jgi:RNA polymerase sigma-70 factor (ECF subfamily)